MEILLVLHDRLADASILFAAICGLWGLWAYWQKQTVSSNYWGTLVIGELLLIVEGLIGLALVIAGQQPDRTIHFLYGVVAALAWPAAFAYTRGQDGRREMLIYGGTSLLVVAFAVRAMMTA